MNKINVLVNQELQKKKRQKIPKYLIICKIIVRYILFTLNHTVDFRNNIKITVITNARNQSLLKLFKTTFKLNDQIFTFSHKIAKSTIKCSFLRGLAAESSHPCPSEELNHPNEKPPLAG